MATSSSNQATFMQLDSGETYQIKGRTMKMEEDELTVQVENPMNFISLTHHKCDKLSEVSRFEWLLQYAEWSNL